jgi:ubiquinone/menaquinone biosynthesis C-methylase UbiE
MKSGNAPGEQTATGGSPLKGRSHDVFPASRARHLDSRLRWLLYRPDRLADQYVKPGDRVLDFGCGPGFFTREFAQKTGDAGTVLAIDLQEEMLRILVENLEPEGLMSRITTHQCAADSLGLSPEWDGRIDAAFAIFVVHEVQDAPKLFREIATVLAPGGLLFISEPPFVVSGREFHNTLRLAGNAGLTKIGNRFYFVNRAAVFRKL